MKKRIFCFIMLMIVLLQLLGCSGDSGIDAYITYAINTPVFNLDPQFATDKTAQMIISNTFSSLLRQDSSGVIRSDAALDYTVSSDGLKYTFFLDERAKWSDDTPITADDFVFAFQRMFNPAAVSPFATDFSSIKNAIQILERDKKPEELGVVAKDTHILEITLEYAYPMFAQLVTTTAASPCNEKFFLSSMGRYGLDKEFLIFNGPFQINTWNNEKTIFLKKNPNYISNTAVLPAGVYLNISTIPTEQLFFDERTDGAKISFENVERAKAMGAKLTQYEDTVWAVVYNQKLPIFANANIRRALSYSIDPNLFRSKLTSNLKLTNQIIPKTVDSMGKSYRSLVGNISSYQFDATVAKLYFEQGLSELRLEKLPLNQILVLEGANHYAIGASVAQSFQHVLASYFNVVEKPLSEFNASIATGNYQVAIMPISSSYDSPSSILNLFQGSSKQNFTGFNNPLYDSYLKAVITSDNKQEILENFVNAERTLLEMGVIAPLFYESSYYATHKNISGFEFFPFGGMVYFKNVKS